MSPGAETLKSMTGYGRAESDWEAGRVTVEVRSLNNRFLEVSVRAPKDLLFLDNELKKNARERFSRGKIEIYISIEGGIKGFSIDIEKARQVLTALEGVAELSGDEVKLEHVLSVGDVVRWNEKADVKGLADVVLSVTGQALDRMSEHRVQEGSAIQKDLAERLKNLRDMSMKMPPLAESVPERIAENLDEFLKRIEKNEVIDNQRLEAEIAILSQKADVSEELSRLETHLDAMEKALSEGGPAGRRMDFLIQEIVREVNTIGSKAGVVDLSSIVVDFKTELERVREQVQNVE
ncbi:MAG: YicC/YloC family endoribonuclease [bacterium]